MKRWDHDKCKREVQLKRSERELYEVESDLSERDEVTGAKKFNYVTRVVSKLDSYGSPSKLYLIFETSSGRSWSPALEVSRRE